jgi:hypothetical protein
LVKRARDAAWEAELDAYYAKRTKAEVEEERTYHAAVRRSLRGRDFDRQGE